MGPMELNGGREVAHELPGDEQRGAREQVGDGVRVELTGRDPGDFY